MRVLTAGISSAMFFLTACGGGGGGSGEPAPINDAAPTTESEPATEQVVSSDPDPKLRLMKDGDQFSYDLAFSDAALGESGSGTVEMVFGGIYTNSHGIECLNLNTTAVISILGRTITGTSKSPGYQDADGAIYSCGEYVGANVVEVDAPDGLSKEIPSPLQVGQVHSYLATLTDGSWSDCTFEVEAFESVDVPAGSFEAYRTKESCSESDGTSTVITSWLSPTHFMVRRDYQEGSETGTFVLKSFSFAQ